MFPAHAGMNRLYQRVRTWTMNVPRTRGDEPTVAPPQKGSMYVPRTRGDEPLL